MTDLLKIDPLREDEKEKLHGGFKVINLTSNAAATKTENVNCVYATADKNRNCGCRDCNSSCGTIIDPLPGGGIDHNPNFIC